MAGTLFARVVRVEFEDVCHTAISTPTTAECKEEGISHQDRWSDHNHRRRKRNSEQYKSFLLELVTIKAFNKTTINGHLWNQLKGVMEYIKDNVNQEGFTLKDPGNSNNDVIETLTEWDRDQFSNDMKRIIENIEDDENDMKIYFPINEDFEEDSDSEGGYGVKIGSASLASVPPDTRFG